VGSHIQVINLDLSFNWNSFSRNIFHNLNLEIEQGSFVSVTGGNGSGKSSLLKLILGLIAPEEGQVFVQGKAVLPGYPDAIQTNQLAYLAQQIEDLFLADTVIEELAYSPMPGKQEAQKILEDLGISVLLNRSIESLSGGERQALALAQFVIQDAPLLILDEPSSYLDQSRAAWLKTYLAQAHSEGKTILHVTQYPVELEWGTHIIDLDQEQPEVAKL